MKLVTLKTHCELIDCTKQHSFNVLQGICKRAYRCLTAARTWSIRLPQSEIPVVAV
jgi:hypothetical protein